MTDIRVGGETIELGRVGENGSRRVIFDVAPYLQEYPDAAFTLLYRAHGSETAYPVAGIERDGGSLYWTVSSADLPEAGDGRCELVVMNGDVIVKSTIWQTRTLPALDGKGTPPEPWKAWQEAFTRLNDRVDAMLTELEHLTAWAETLPAGSDATAAYEDGALRFGIPQGEKGDTGATGPEGPAGKDGADGKDGKDGADGKDGQDGYSPAASVSKSGNTATITITDKSGTTTATVSDGQNGQDGAPGVGVPTGGTAGQMLAKASGTDYDTEWADAPVSPVQDVTVNGASVLDNGVAVIPNASTTVFGSVRIGSGLYVGNNGTLYVNPATDAQIKGGTNGQNPIGAATQHTSVFYGLAKLAGADLKSSTTPVGTYPDESIDKILALLGIDDLIGPHEGATASQTYAVGDAFIHSGKLYKTTSAISQNDAIVPGTNCAQTTIIDLLKGA